MTDRVVLQHHKDPNRTMTIDVVKRDAAGRLTEGWAVNRQFTLRADHARGVFWQAEFPRMIIKTAMYTGWTK